MLGILAGQSHLCFLDGYSGYTQITIILEDQEKTTFTCSFGNFAFRRMPFSLYNAIATFQRCMMRIFAEYGGHNIVVFMDEFIVRGDSFDMPLEFESCFSEDALELNLFLIFKKFNSWCNKVMFLVTLCHLQV